MTGDFSASLHLEDAKACHDLMMAQFSKFGAISYDCALFTPCAHDNIIVFIIRDRYRTMNYISDLAKQGIRLSCKLLILWL